MNKPNCAQMRNRGGKQTKLSSYDLLRSTNYKGYYNGMQGWTGQVCYCAATVAATIVSNFHIGTFIKICQLYGTTANRNNKFSTKPKFYEYVENTYRF